MKGKSLSLDSEEDLHGMVNILDKVVALILITIFISSDVFNDGSNNTSKKMKFSKGSSSKDAYMLVYCRQGDG